jgi:synaptotagmin-1
MCCLIVVPVWGVVVVGVMALSIILICCGCLCKMCWKRRKDKTFKKGLKSAVDLKSVQMLGSAMKEKV